MKHHPAEDAEHLRLLSIGTFILSGMTALFSLFPIIHLMIGIGLLTGIIPEPPPSKSNQDIPPWVIGAIFTVMPAIFILFGLVFALLMAVAAWNLRQYRAYRFCLIVAALECMMMPLGPVIGIFTIMVLLRPSVRELFGLESYAQK